MFEEIYFSQFKKKEMKALILKKPLEWRIKKIYTYTYYNKIVSKEKRKF